jgi:hypothetical protein
MEEFVARIGTFFLLIGVFLFIIFLASDMGKQTDFDYLFLAIIAVVAGWMMQRKRPRPPSAGRFGYIRRMRAGAKKKPGEKQKPKQEEKAK